MTTHPTRRSTLRRLAFSTVLAGGALSALPASAQVNTPQAPTVRAGTVTFSDAGGGALTTAQVNGTPATLNVDVASETAVIGWNSFNVSAAGTLNFTTARADATAVLNRVANGISAIDGAINAPSNLAVWLANPQGIIVGANGAISTGTFVATTANITDANFTGGALGGPGGTGRVRLSGGTGFISLNGDAAQHATITSTGPVVFVAPRINSNAAVAGSDVAFVVATDATLLARPGSPVGITLVAGTPVADSNVIAGTVDGARVYLAGARQADALASLLRIEADVTATAGADGRVVIASAPGTTGGLTINNIAGLTDGFAGIAVTGDIAAAAGATGGVTIAARGDVAAGGGIATGGAIATGGTTLALGAGGQARAFSAGEGVTLTASGGDITGAGALAITANSAGGALPILLRTDAANAAILAGGTSLNAGAGTVQIVTADANGALALGDITAARLRSAAGAPVANGITRNADLTLGDVTLTGSRLVLTTIGGADLTVGDVDAAQGIALTSGDRLATGALDGGAVTLAFGAGGLGTGAITSVGALSATGAGPISIASAAITGGGAVVTATDAASGVTIVGGLSAEGAVTVTAGTDILATSLATTTGNVTANYGGTLAGTGGGRAALSTGTGAIDVNGGAAARLGAVSGTSVAIDATTIDAASITATGAVALTGGAGGVTTGGLSGGFTTIVTPGTTTLNGVTTVANGSTIGGDAGVRFGTVNGTRNLTIASLNGNVGGTTATTVGGRLTLSAGADLSVGTISAIDNPVTAAGGGATLTAAGDIAVGSLTAGRGGVTATAAGDLMADSLMVTGTGDATLATTGTRAALGTAAVDGDLRLDSAGLAIVTGNVTTGGTYTVVGDTIALGGAGAVQQAGGRITLTAAAGIVGNAGLALTGGAGGIGVDAGAGIQFAGTTVTATGGGALGLRTGAGGSVQLGTVTAGQVGGLGAGTPPAFAATYLGTGDFTADSITATSLRIDLTGGRIAIGAIAGDPAVALDTDGAIALGDVAASTLALRTGGALSGGRLESAGNLVVTAASIDAARLASAAGSVTATATAGGLSVDTTSAFTGARLLATGAGNISLGTVDAGTGVLIDAAAGGLGVDRVGAPGGITLSATGSITGRVLANGTRLQASGAGVRVTAGDVALIESAVAGGGSLAVTARSLTVRTASTTARLTLDAVNGPLTLGSGVAAGNALLTTPGVATVDSLTAGGGVAIDVGTLTARRLSATGGIAVTADDVATIDTITGATIDVSAGTLNVRLAEAATTLELESLAGPLSLTTGTAGGAATLTSASMLTVGSQLTAGGAATLRAGETALVAGVTSTGDAVTITGRAAQIGTASAFGALTITGTAGNVTLNDGRGARATVSATGDLGIGTLATTAGDAALSARDGALTGGTITARTVARTQSGGATVVDTLTGGTGVDVRGGSVDLRVVSATAGALGVTSTAGPLTVGRGSAGTTATLDSAGALTVQGRLSAPGAVRLRAGEAVAASEVASTGGAVTITGRSAAIGSATAAGVLTITGSAGDVSLNTGEGTAATVFASGNLTAGSVTATTGDARLVAQTGALTVDSIDAAVSATTVSGGAATIETLTAGTGDVGVTAGGVARLGTVSGQSVGVSARGIDARTVNALGSDATLVANGGDLLLGSLQAVRTATLRATDAFAADSIDAFATTLTAGGAATIGRWLGSDNRATAGSLMLREGIGLGLFRLVTTGGPMAIGSISGTTVDLTSAATLDVATRLLGTFRVVTNSVGATTIGDLQGGFVGSSVDIAGSSVDIGTVAAGAPLTVTARSGSARVGGGSASSTVTIAASGGDAVIDRPLTTGRAVSVTASGNAVIDSVTTDNGAITIAASGDVLGVGGGADLVAGTASAIDVRASGAAQLGTVRGGTVSLAAASGPLTLADGTAIDTATLTSGGALTVTGTLTATNRLEARAAGAVDINAARSFQRDVTITGRSVRAGSAIAATTLAVTSTAGDASVVRGGGETGATLSASGGDAVVGEFFGSGTGPTSIATDRSARLAEIATINGPLTVTASGDLSATSLRAGNAGALTATANGQVAVGSAQGGAVALTAVAGPLRLGTATGTTAMLRSGGDLDVTGALTAVDAVSVSTGGAARLASVDGRSLTLTGASVSADVARATEALSVTATNGTARIGTGRAGTTASLSATRGDAIVATQLRSGGATTIDATGNVQLASVTTDRGALSVTAGGAATLGTATTNGALTVTAGSISGGSIAVTGAATLTSRGALSVAGSATAGVTLQAVGVATLGALNAGPTLTLTATDAVITGTQTAGAITIVNRNTGSQGLRIGDGIDAAGFQLSEAEVARLVTPTLTFDGGNGLIELGNLRLADTAGSSRVNVLTTGIVRVLGTVADSAPVGAAPPATAPAITRTVQIGGTVTAADVQATQIRIQTRPTGGGRLTFGYSTALDLRGNRIAQGQTSLLDQLFAGAEGLSGEIAGLRFTSRADSLLYNAGLPGATPYDAASPTAISAGRLTVNYDTFALFQNTGRPGANTGAILGFPGAPGALVLTGSGTLIPNTFALFGVIGGASDQTAAVVGGGVLVVNDINLTSSRINGCLILTGAGCLSTTITQPPLNVFDQSRLNILSSAEDFAVPFDPVIGGNNEALFAGVSAIDVPVTGTECEDGSTDPQCTGGSNQETNP